MARDEVLRVGNPRRFAPLTSPRSGARASRLASLVLAMVDVPWRREEGEGAAQALVLTLHVQPGARRTEVAGRHGGALRIRLAAPPVEGKANAALLRFLAAAFDVPQRAVTLVRGETSRQKTVRIVAPQARPDRAW